MVSAKRQKLFPIVGIGASAGGLEAFTQFLKHLPADTGMGFVLVQHLDPVHASALTAILARATAMPVYEVTNDLRVEPNHVYVIPPNMGLEISKGLLKLQPRNHQARGAQHSIDSFFESLASDRAERAIGVVLSGTATDGTLGLEAIKAEGGITFAQDESAKFDSMPRSAIAAGCVDFVLSPESIAQEVARIAQHPFVAGAGGDSLLPPEAEREADQREGPEDSLASGGRGTPNTGAKQARAEARAGGDDPPAVGENGFKKILLLLRSHCGVDFSLYKSSTIQRRIARRMVLNRQTAPGDYAAFLRGNAKELDALYSDVLISVTSFFRNAEAFEALKRQVFPALMTQRGREEPMRVWTLGCSTGQEAYSIAMSFAEFAEKLPRAPKLQIFATDLNEALLEKARQGLYAKTLAQDLSPERLRRFFVEEEGGYRIIKALRAQVVFARQNIMSDPPFSRMDLISCRNLLIYLDAGLQKKIMPAFHYALKPRGFLFLGASELVGQFTDLFEPADKKQKIFSRKAAATPSFRLPLPHERSASPSSGKRPLNPVERAQGLPEGIRGEFNAQREADRLMVSQFAPPGVLIDAGLKVLQFRGATGAYLEPPVGKASFDLL
ncbi:MAG: chemotaxis protein CheB, partial [Opitutaceae bacterium]